MVKRIKLLFLLLGTMFLVSESFGQRPNLAGGEVYYELISPLKYKVTAHVYRMCDQTPLRGLTAYVFAGPYQIPMSFTRTAISKINNNCGNPCNIQNEVSNAGFEKHTFEAAVDFNASPYDAVVANKTCLVHFAILMNARPYSVTNYNIATNLYLDASTDICLSSITKNISPKFSMEPKFQAYANATFSYSPGPLDTMDNDSFVFSLVAPQSHVNTYLSYYGKLTSQIPMTPYCAQSGTVNCSPDPSAKPAKGFYFDKKTCMTIFTPIGGAEVGTIRYRIDEYRFNKQKQKHEWLGNVTREMMVQIVGSGGNNPTVIPTDNVLNVCKGNKVCTTIVTTDTKGSNQSQADTTTLFWDKGVKDASFRILDSSAREKKGEFCWQTKKNTGRTETYYFTVAAFDQKCNVNLTTKTFSVDANPVRDYKYVNTMGSCGKVKWTASAVYDSFYPNYRGICKTVVKTLQTNAIVYSGNGMKDSTVIHSDGTFVIEHIFDTLCPVTVRDTFTLTGTLKVPDILTTANAIVCKEQNPSFSFKPSGLNGLTSFEWSLNDSVINIKDSLIKIKFTVNSKVRLKVENNWGCREEKTLSFTMKQHPDAVSNIGEVSCPGSLLGIVSNAGTLKRPISYRWKVNGRDTGLNDSIFFFKIYENTKVLLTITDAEKCVFTDSVFETAWPSVNFKLEYKNEVCRDSFSTVKAKNIMAVQPYTYLWLVNGVDIEKFDSVVQLKVTDNLALSLQISDVNGCKLKVPASIQTVNTPEVILPDRIQTCINSTLSIVPQINNQPASVVYQWTYNKAIIGSNAGLTRKFPNSQILKLRASNSLGCSTEDEVSVELFPLSQLTILGDLDYKPNSIITLNAKQTFVSYKWSTGGTSQMNIFKAETLGPPGKYKVWCKATDAYGCNYFDTVEIFTNAFVGLDKAGLVGLKIYPNPVNHYLTIESVGNATMELYTADGRSLARYELKEGLNSIDLSAYASGVYFVKVFGEGRSDVMKLIKE